MGRLLGRAGSTGKVPTLVSTPYRLHVANRARGRIQQMKNEKLMEGGGGAILVGALDGVGVDATADSVAAEGVALVFIA